MLRKYKQSYPINSPAFTTIIPNAIANAVLYSVNGGFPGFNERLVIPTTRLYQNYSGNGWATVNLMLGGTTNGTLDGLYLGHQATISATNLTSGNSTSATSSATTVSISPGINKLDIVSVTGSLSTVPTVTGAGGTWVLIASKFDAGGNRGVHMFRDLSSSPGSGALTIDFGGVNQNFIGWSIDEFSGTDASGTHGSGAIIQSVGNNSSGTQTGITTTLAALASTRNVAYGFLRNNSSNVISPGTGFTELSNNLLGELDAEWAVNKTAVAWTWASQTVTSVAMAIEIKASVYAFDGNQVQMTFNGKTSLSFYGGAVVASDPVKLLYAPTTPLIVSSHWSGTTVLGLSLPLGPTGCNQFFSGASQASVSTPTGAWSNDNNWTFVSSVTFRPI